MTHNLTVHSVPIGCFKLLLYLRSCSHHCYCLTGSVNQMMSIGVQCNYKMIGKFCAIDSSLYGLSYNYYDISYICSFHW